MGWFDEVVSHVGGTSAGGLIGGPVGALVGGAGSLGGAKGLGGLFDGAKGGMSGNWMSDMNGFMGDKSGGGDWSLGGLTGANAARDAAQMQADAAAAANDTQRYIFDQGRADQMPWRQTGIRALAGMENGDFQRDFSAGDFQKDPGYQFRLAEGQKALDRASAVRGGRSSGATMKALGRYNQDFASNEYSNVYNRFNQDRDRRFNRLASLAGVGQTANNNMGQMGLNYGNNVSQNQIGVGNAQAASRMQQQQQQNSMLQTGAMAAMMMA